MSKTTITSSMWLDATCSNGAFLSKNLVDLIDVGYLSTEYCTIFEYVQVGLPNYKQLEPSGLKHEKLVQAQTLDGGKYV